MVPPQNIQNGNITVAIFQSHYLRHFSSCQLIHYSDLITSGGRGKGAFIGSSMSGVGFCNTAKEVTDLSAKMIGRDSR